MIRHLILISLAISQSYCHTPINGSDIIILGGHADLVRDNHFFVTTRRPVMTSRVWTTPSTISTARSTTVMSESEEMAADQGKDDVVFVPAEREVVRNDHRGGYHDDTMRLSDVYSNKKKLGDMVEKEPETQNGDVLFLPSKYSNVQDKPQRTNEEDERRHMDAHFSNRRSGVEKRGKPAETTTELDCTWRVCDQEINSICGGKREITTWRFRLFRNECYFNKVNCQFSWPKNRYIRLDLKLCKNVGSHYTPRESPLRFMPMQSSDAGPDSRKKSAETRRVMSGRRAISLSLSGINCEHVCPLTCTEDYAPECAVSSTGEKRVFRNHCVMDDNSCKFGSMWRVRPLSDCIGTKKADVQQNRAFIDWMLRIGLVDSKGKLVMQ